MSGVITSIIQTFFSDLYFPIVFIGILNPVSYTHLDVYKRQVKQFEQWYYNAPDKDRLAGYANFRNQYPHYDSQLLQNPFIDFRFHGRCV